MNDGNFTSVDVSTYTYIGNCDDYQEKETGFSQATLRRSDFMRGTRTIGHIAIVVRIMS